MERAAAVDRVLRLIETIDTQPTPVPIREVWVLGDLALGLDPVDRLDIYVRKELLFTAEEPDYDPAAEEKFVDEFGIQGIGKAVSARWSTAFPESIRTNDHGHAAPERCLAAFLLPPDEPIHLEICNAGFEQNVMQRIQTAVARERFEQILDPRGVCIWKDGITSETAPNKLREGEYIFPPLAEALQSLGMDADLAELAADAVGQWREDTQGTSHRADVL